MGKKHQRKLKSKLRSKSKVLYDLQIKTFFYLTHQIAQKDNSFPEKH